MINNTVSTCIGIGEGGERRRRGERKGREGRKRREGGEEEGGESYM